MSVEAPPAEPAAEDLPAVAGTSAPQEPVALPDAGQVAAMLNGLYDKPVVAHQEPAPVLRGRDVRMVGCYVQEDGTLRALILLDLTLGAALGAALAMLPSGKVQEAVGADGVPKDLADNTYEVLNIAASLFNGAQAHLKLRDVQVAPEPVTEDVVEFLRGTAHRQDVRVEVPGYGTGALAVLVEL